MSSHANFLADCRRYLDLVEEAADKKEMGLAISSAWQADICVVNLARALEDDRVKINKVKRAKAKTKGAQ